MADMRNGSMDYDAYRNKFHDLREERRNAKKKERRKKIIGIVVIASVVIVGFATKNLWMPPVADFFENSRDTIINDGTPENGNGFPITLSQSEQNHITSLGGMPAVISDTHITIYNSKGGISKKIQHTCANPVYYEMGEKLFVYDLNGYNFSVYDKKGEIYSKKTESAIVMAACSDSDMVAVVTQTENFTSYLTVYDENGDAVFKWSGGQRIVNVSFNEKEDGCIISTFTSSGGRIVSKLFGLEFDKTEPTFETAELDCLVYKAGYCKNGDMWLLGDSILYRVGADGSVIYKYDYPRELSAYDLSEEVAVLVFDGVAGNTQEITVFSDDEEPSVLKINGEIKKLDIVDGDVAYLTQSSFAFLNDNAKVIAVAELDKSYSDFLVIDNDVFFIGYNEVDKINFDR